MCRTSTRKELKGDVKLTKCERNRYDRRKKEDATQQEKIMVRINHKRREIEGCIKRQIGR